VGSLGRCLVEVQIADSLLHIQARYIELPVFVLLIAGYVLILDISTTGAANFDFQVLQYVTDMPHSYSKPTL